MRKLATLSGLGLLVCFAASVLLHAGSAATLLALAERPTPSDAAGEGDSESEVEVELQGDGEQKQNGPEAPLGGLTEEQEKGEDALGKALQELLKPEAEPAPPPPPAVADVQVKKPEKPPPVEKELPPLPPSTPAGAEGEAEAQAEAKNQAGNDKGGDFPSVPDPEGIGLPGQRSNGNGINGLDAQRARLGEAQACPDPVAGTWQSKVYDAERRQWYSFTLKMRNEAGVLWGSIESRFWVGRPNNSKSPSSCVDTPLYAVVSMPARGVVDGTRIRFGARSWNLEHAYCGPPYVSYSPDRFRGTVDANNNELQAMVSDDTNWMDQPMLFRRVDCAVPLGELSPLKVDKNTQLY